MFVEYAHGVFLALNVRKVPGPVDARSAAKQDLGRWQKFKDWRLVNEEERSDGAVTYLVQRASFTLVDEEAPEEAERLTVRLLHSVFGDAHVTVALLADCGMDRAVDGVAQRVLKGLKPPPAATGPGPCPQPQASAASPTDDRAGTGAPAKEAVPFAPPPGATVFDPLPAAFTVPQSWRLAEKQRDSALLVSDTEPGMILVHVGYYRVFDGCYTDLSKGFGLLKLSGRATDGPRDESIADQPGTFACYEGHAEDGTPVAARYRAVLSRGGLSLAVCGITTPDQIARQAPRVDAIARSFLLGALEPDRQTMASLLGRWSRYRGSSSGSQSSASGGTSSSSFASFTFREDGTFSYDSESSLSVTGAATGEGTQGSAFSGSSQQDQGRYMVVKNLLILSSDKGGSEIYELRVEPNRFALGDVVYVR
jgi:hypothetical protein